MAPGAAAVAVADSLAIGDIYKAIGEAYLVAKS